MTFLAAAPGELHGSAARIFVAPRGLASAARRVIHVPDCPGARETARYP
ncbi:hypothetical protein ACFXJO_12670 [Streptomyces lavendulae]